MKRVTSAWTVGIVVCAATVVGACNRTPAEQDTAQAPAAQTESAQRHDAAITTSVQAKYYGDDMVRARNIDVSTEDGVVTLRGTVDNEAARQQAVNLAQSVEGVSRVEDQLRVATQTADAREDQAPRTEGPTEATGTAGRAAADTVQPAWITTKIQSQYFVNPEIKPWNIDVTTQSNGVVTLEGEVDSAADKAEAVRIARATEGVTNVEDRLRVKGEERSETEEPAAAPGEPETGVTAPDAWLTAKIQAKYFMDPEVKGREIDVDTRNGVVTLKGAVGSEAERRQAVALARNTDGVESVTDSLDVQPSLAEESGATRPGAEKVPPVTPVLDDTWITTKIQSKYFLDATVKGHQINVDTQKGVVTLTGTVDTEQQKKEAEAIARGTDGVAKVINNLAVGGR